jgi:hypothetical protein
LSPNNPYARDQLLDSCRHLVALKSGSRCHAPAQSCLGSYVLVRKVNWKLLVDSVQQRPPSKLEPIAFPSGTGRGPTGFRQPPAAPPHPLPRPQKTQAAAPVPATAAPAMRAAGATHSPWWSITPPRPPVPVPPRPGRCQDEGEGAGACSWLVAAAQGQATPTVPTLLGRPAPAPAPPGASGTSGPRP